MPSLLPPSEDEYLAQYVCDELYKVDGDNSGSVIKEAAKQILLELITDDRDLAKAVRKELFMCYPKIFVDDDDLPKI